jgi:hypothetical protein
MMNHEILAETPDARAGRNLITIASEDGVRIEMTWKNHLQLEREMACMLDDPLATVMEQLTLEYQAMARQ